LDLVILPAGLVRSQKRYLKGSDFSTYDLKSIFAFGCKMVIFELERNQLKKFKEGFSKKTGKGAYP
jgi:hypothetical protein